MNDRSEPMTDSVDDCREETGLAILPYTVQCLTGEETGAQRG